MQSKVTIGIQARSTSKRLPNKVMERLGSKSILKHVLDACFGASNYINNMSTKGITCDVALCIPVGDEIKTRSWGSVKIVEGPEDNVLERYHILLNECMPDYVVRITADCPLIPSFVISKIITIAVMNRYDYVSNVDEQCRTSIDGFDCEVMSSRILRYAYENAKSPKDLEHVTTYIRSYFPTWGRKAVVINFMDQSHMKLSVDTTEDLERVRGEVEKIETALSRAHSQFGRENVYRF